MAWGGDCSGAVPFELVGVTVTLRMGVIVIVPGNWGFSAGHIDGNTGAIEYHGQDGGGPWRGSCTQTVVRPGSAMPGPITNQGWKDVSAGGSHGREGA